MAGAAPLFGMSIGLLKRLDDVLNIADRQPSERHVAPHASHAGSGGVCTGLALAKVRQATKRTPAAP